MKRAFNWIGAGLSGLVALFGLYGGLVSLNSSRYEDFEVGPEFYYIVAGLFFMLTILAGWGSFRLAKTARSKTADT